MKSLYIIIIIFFIVFSIEIAILINRHHNKKVKKSDYTDTSILATKEKSQGKGKPGNWGKYQHEYIQYIIARSLLNTQTRLSHENMDIKEFLDDINICLECITKNFSSKYSYSDIIIRVQNAGKYKDFDVWFKKLYTICDCNDKLGLLLTKLLKEYWTNEVYNNCPKSKEQLKDCIKQINVSDFKDSSKLDNMYHMLEYCVGKSCPKLLNNK